MWTVAELLEVIRTIEIPIQVAGLKVQETATGRFIVSSNDRSIFESFSAKDDAISFCFRMAKIIRSR